MPAAVLKLERATPEERDGVPGFALTWPAGSMSPEWLSAEDFRSMFRGNRYDPDAVAAIRAAYNAGKVDQAEG